MDNEIELFNNDNSGDLLGVYQEAAKHLDSFITLINDAALHKELSEDELFDLETMSDLSGTMLIQLLNFKLSSHAFGNTLTETTGRIGSISFRNHPCCQVRNKVQTLQGNNAGC